MSRKVYPKIYCTLLSLLAIIVTKCAVVFAVLVRFANNLPRYCSNLKAPWTRTGDKWTAFAAIHPTAPQFFGDYAVLCRILTARGTGKYRCVALAMRWRAHLTEFLQRAEEVLGIIRTN